MSIARYFPPLAALVFCAAPLAAAVIKQALAQPDLP